jgi:hypothetical protein
MPVILPLKRQRQKDYDLKTCLDYIVRPGERKKNRGREGKKEGRKGRREGGRDRRKRKRKEKKKKAQEVLPTNFRLLIALEQKS